jgi:hypothetical protein
MTLRWARCEGERGELRYIFARLTKPATAVFPLSPATTVDWIGIAPAARLATFVNGVAWA